MDRIMALRDRAMEHGYDKTYGPRHTDAFEESVAHSGWLDELRLPIKTFGIFNFPALMSMAPVGLRAFLRGKLPPIFHRPVPGVKKVRQLVKSVKDQQQEE